MPQAPRVEARESMTKIRSRGNRVVRIEPPGMSPSDAVKLMQLRYRLNGQVPDSDRDYVDPRRPPLSEKRTFSGPAFKALSSLNRTIRASSASASPAGPDKLKFESGGYKTPQAEPESRRGFGNYSCGAPKKTSGPRVLGDKSRVGLIMESGAWFHSPAWEWDEGELGTGSFGLHDDLAGRYRRSDSAPGRTVRKISRKCERRPTRRFRSILRRIRKIEDWVADDAV